ncbi:LacI family DNA-binding transcriptional regulator [Paraburkholderia rhizosphaerae]|uniref:LacI family transcriptional regulator n=1 Tax=Paraburkholderia rhizosphaerae TaxID=480658 RepID=A0A4R8LKR7_9BURK|nr:substrate-binding domain-containing protein [Paraburkholderia rhizosphaerae]TDY43239.1 LacI family transcriptional regulator [Paraburkholderia rhizosphaerae]
MNIREFAATLGLSISTVSKALNGREDVSAATRERVLAAARRSAFFPDPSASRLRRQSSDTVAFVISPPQTSFAHPFFLDMLMGVNEAIDHSRYQLIIASARSVETELDLIKRLVERQRVDALLFGRTRRQDERIAYLVEREIPFVAFGRSETSNAFPYVDIDSRVVGRSGCGRFIALGHRRIALVHAPEYLTFSHLERAGYEEALRGAGIAIDPTLCIETSISEPAGADAARRLLELPDPPSAILAGHDLIAMGVMRGITETGRTPGRDIGVIGSDDDPIGRYIQPSLTTFSADTRRAGKRMAEMLLERLAGTPPQQLQEIWEPELIVRASDGPYRVPGSSSEQGNASRRAR